MARILKTRKKTYKKKRCTQKGGGCGMWGCSTKGTNALPPNSPSTYSENGKNRNGTVTVNTGVLTKHTPKRTILPNFVPIAGKGNKILNTGVVSNI